MKIGFQSNRPISNRLLVVSKQEYKISSYKNLNCNYCVQSYDYFYDVEQNQHRKSEIKCSYLLCGKASIVFSNPKIVFSIKLKSQSFLKLKQSSDKI